MCVFIYFVFAHKSVNPPTILTSHILPWIIWAHQDYDLIGILSIKRTESLQLDWITKSCDIRDSVRVVIPSDRNSVHQQIFSAFKNISKLSNFYIDFYIQKPICHIYFGIFRCVSFHQIVFKISKLFFLFYSKPLPYSILTRFEMIPELLNLYFFV